MRAAHARPYALLRLRAIGMPPDAPHLSLVLPVAHGARYIAASVDTVVRCLDDGLAGRPFEIVVVCDGSVDGTVDIARSITDPRVTVFHYPQNQGKGFAISLGIAQARGRYVGWLDADLDIHPEVIVRAVEALEAGDADAVVGSKRHKDSVVDYPTERRLYSWGFQMLIRALFRLNVRDTQVGAKVFRREMLDAVVPLLLIKRYAFDVEVLAVGAAFGFDRVQEVPIELDYRFTGTGINWRAVARMFQDTLAIAYRIHLRHWYVRRWAALHRMRMDLDRVMPSAPPALDEITPMPVATSAGEPGVKPRAGAGRRSGAA